MGSLVYGHFGPKTLQTQDISALVPKCPQDTSAPLIFRFYEKSAYVSFITFR